MTVKLAPTPAGAPAATAPDPAAAPVKPVAPAPAGGAPAVKPAAPVGAPAAGAAPAAAPAKPAEGSEAPVVGLLGGEAAAAALLKEHAEAGTDPAAPASGAPETYDLKAPEGSKIPVSTLERIAADSKARGLTNEQAQAVVDASHQALEDFHQAEAAGFAEQRKAWVKNIANDPVIGRANLAANMAMVEKFVKTEMSPKLQQFFADSGLADNDEVFKFLLKFAKPRNPAREIKGGQPAGQEENLTTDQKLLRSYEARQQAQKSGQPKVGHIVKDTNE